ncbi:MAG TPA: FAD-dependent monooxygenase [Dermatophilaceae bacterium]|nr:FAD-dependent monooxygenase [Dermatophilaceae bacterium]
MNSEPVVIVGAGPTGLVLACSLALHGVSVRVLDKAAGPATTSRALGLQPRGTEVLDRIGALGDLPEHSLGVHQVVVHVGGRELARLEVGRLTRRVRRRGLLVSQARIEAQLRGRLAELGGEVTWAAEVAGVTQTDSAATVQLAGGGTVQASWVVGCDGAHSRVRKAAGIGFPGVPLAERFLLADVRADLALDRGCVQVWLDGQDMFAAFPLPGPDRWRLMAPASASSATSATVDDASVVEALKASLPACGLSPDLVRETFWTSSFSFHRRLADTYRVGRLLLAGDAAHIHSPFGGQGLNTGIGDAENLAWKLALVWAGRADPRLLDTYQAERRPIAEEVLANTSGMTKLMLGGSLGARLVRDHLMVPLMNRPLVQRLIWERASQLLISYRGGPLAARRLTWSGPRPGDRVADLPCRTVDAGHSRHGEHSGQGGEGHRGGGAATRLHVELGHGFAVVGSPDALCARAAEVAAGWLGEVTCLRRSEGEVHGIQLVRPDAHLAWSGTDLDAMTAWLASATGRTAPSRALAGVG